MTEGDKVQLRIDVDAEYRSRLKAVAARLNMTMGDLIQKFSNEQITLEQLETQYYNTPATKSDRTAKPAKGK